MFLKSISLWKRWILMLFLMCAVISSTLLISNNVGSTEGVPVAPNDSMVTGVVLEYAILNSRLVDIEPEQVLHALQIEVLTSEDVPGMANFTKDKVGEIIRVYSTGWLSPYLFGKTIRANVQFRGDERGGKYWIRNVSLAAEEAEG